VVQVAMGARTQNSFPSGSLRTTADIVTLADIDMCRAERDRTIDLCSLIHGPQVEMHAVLRDLLVGNLHEEDVRCDVDARVALGGSDRPFALAPMRDPPPEGTRPEGREPLAVVAVDHDALDTKIHHPKLSGD